MVFWLACLALVLVVTLCVLIPIYASSSRSGAHYDRDTLNRDLYHQRVNELALESDSGLVEDNKLLTKELQRTLLDDVPADKRNRSLSTRGLMGVVFGVLVFALVVSYSLYTQVGARAQVLGWQETARRLPELSQRLMQEESTPLDTQELADLTLALRTRLHQMPDDPMGWLLLGRLGMASRDVDMAIGAMRQAWGLAPDMFETRFGYAQSLLLSGDAVNAQRGRQFLAQLIQEDPDNLQVLSLLAFDAFEAQDYRSAIAMWSRMQSLLPSDDPRAQMLARSIAQAQQSIVGDPVLLSVVVTIPDRTTLPAQGVLFVSVHRVDGSPMPVAAKRVPLSAFPLTVHLRNSDSMLESNQLQDMTEMIVRARIDADGNLGTKESGWRGERVNVALGENVRVDIMQQGAF
ncbi:c-type cytochrome biogenesis protein CcmI [Thaumasiovibrio sp. DFM-14]|uniref:c-type cytochrome biogenesis protein CcmI n=1 Tax=Thaumasiovibrio sp. DFM-14 TaxID=3384792 RepID=UPI0039A277A7